MERWLYGFAYRIEIPWSLFAVASLLAVAIAVLTVSYQSVKAATTNPARTLRSE